VTKSRRIVWQRVRVSIRVRANFRVRVRLVENKKLR